MTANVDVRKINNNVEKMDGGRSSIKIIIVPLNDRLTTFFGDDTTAEEITLTKDDCKISYEINTVPFKEWMTATFSVRETDNLLQGMEGCN